MHISLEIDYNAVQYFYRNFDGGYKEQQAAIEQFHQAFHARSSASFNKLIEEQIEKAQKN